LELPLSNVWLASERSPFIFIMAWDDSKEDCCCAIATWFTEVGETYIKKREHETNWIEQNVSKKE
jgi:hypothetical protein